MHLCQSQFVSFLPPSEDNSCILESYLDPLSFPRLLQLPAYNPTKNCIICRKEVKPMQLEQVQQMQMQEER